MWTHTRLELMGSTVQLFCRPSGSPKPAVAWFGPDDNALQSGDKYKARKPQFPRLSVRDGDT